MDAGQEQMPGKAAPPPPVTAAFISPRRDDWYSGGRFKLWIVLAALILLAAGVTLSFAVRGFVQARSRADVLVSQLHTRMNQKDWSDIYGDADAVYQGGLSSGDSEALFAAINRKLGQVKHTSQQTTNLTVNTSGSTITAHFETQFAGDEHATETIVWRSLGGKYHLHSYSIQSLPLLTR